MSNINEFTGLPKPWTIKTSKTHNQEYYYNPETQESTWNIPTGSDESKLNAYLSKGLNKPSKVRASHLLVKHKDVRRPSSWKEQTITRTREEAIEILKKYQDQINRGESTLGDLAYDNSDCSSHSKKGDLGFFGRGEMQPSFEKAAFDLQVGEVSDIVESNSGVHLIERTG
ncbi:hypothetical protein CANARDRAFT_29869 [[Candida] arabinofermentans NRRL YB-2248]|uniref:Peptidyl-prolyl cis-trans isomerase n=1 Tax=[Candida] arabinofermentans NRRL YB-2248 TaxID=983967 RepID=A0A1E4SVX0_9ASCO|nr:hypothetical protein CANARDRAFT_29869 [[Candida] arabinofermentans NRRL YB-2248]